MGFTKAEAIAAIRNNTKGAEAGDLLNALDDMDESVLISLTVNLAEDGQFGVLAAVRRLVKHGESLSYCCFHWSVKELFR